MNEPWFRHKEIGYGAGLPIHWKGWALVALYLVILFGFPYALEFLLGYPPQVPERVATITLITIPFLWLVKRKTEGGWRWRRGSQDS